MSKQYGLIIPGQGPIKPTSQGFTKGNVFGDDDSDEDAPKTKSKAPLGPGVNQKRQARLAQEKAIIDDPTVYQYDELYDEMAAKKAESKKDKSKIEKKPKYINKLLETAEKRKKEQERRIERQVQKERETEGEKFADKESFVTSSYRKKLEEMKVLEQEEKREEYLESIGDVTKQQDLGGFYRHLYSQQLGEENKSADITTSAENHDQNSKTADSTEESQLSPSHVVKIPKIKAKKRVYRKRSASDEEDVANASDDTKNHLQSNLDADSDFSIDSSDTEPENDDNPTNKDPVKISDALTIAPVDTIVVKQEPVDNDKTSLWNDGFKIPGKLQKLEDNTNIKEEKIIKIDIWKKRTVGETFQSALERYYVRKSQRSIKV